MLCEPNSSFVVQMFKYGGLPLHPSYYYIDMEYLGETLDWRICRIREAGTPLISLTKDDSGPVVFPPQLILVTKIVQDIAMGLAYIHWKGLTHRDLKPSNGKALNNYS